MKFSKIIIVLIIILIIGIGIFEFVEKNSIKRNIDVSAENNINNIQLTQEEIEDGIEIMQNGCKYKYFKPIFKTSPDSEYNNYDYTQDMIYQDKIYNKKISNYEEYKIVKDRWNEIIDMNETDFKDNYMVITAIENTSMLGLKVDKVEIDNNILYISLIRHDEFSKEFEQYVKSGNTRNFTPEQIEEFKELEKGYEKTCICYLIPKTMDCEKIVATRNLRDDEKIFKESFYEIKNETFKVTNDMLDINFSNWEKVGKDLYALRITEHDEYEKMVNNYNISDMKWMELEDVFAVIIINAKDSNSIEVEDIDGTTVQIKKLNSINENSKYSGIVLKVPNYMNLEKNYLNIVEK